MYVDAWSREKPLILGGKLKKIYEVDSTINSTPVLNSPAKNIPL